METASKEEEEEDEFEAKLGALMRPAIEESENGVRRRGVHGHRVTRKTTGRRAEARNFEG